MMKDKATLMNIVEEAGIELYIKSAFSVRKTL